MVLRKHPRYARNVSRLIESSKVTAVQSTTSLTLALATARSARHNALLNIMGVSDCSCAGSEQSSNRFSYTGTITTVIVINNFCHAALTLLYGRRAGLNY